uniref:ABC transporter-related protein (ABC-2.A) n=3 Tax=environmental samples TaxID=68359 RepID=A0A075HPG3_9EURY|nr:ABC transporter-related protein (ABC-2.A) [uncultured marine group II/III euryarchaeote KM3_141_A08]AIF17749.1 ABC transporter-related protein (ABC-2.A) [uncultured marine group II/III euryarchaeote KM3_79_B02]AIF20379.1 ABC transporter-related protein (ABC-2.A) [uncultured marine group II/III euryarchaeote KM3_89_F04]
MRDVSFSVERGDFFGLLGPNGAGKTTLLKVLTGQIHASSGEAEVLGLPVAQQPLEVRSRAGIVPEQSTPPSFLTPREVLELVVAVRGCEVDLEWWLEFFEFEESEGRICRTLSRGQRQKVLLAAAFIAQPEVLFLDEPFINLDPLVQAKVRDWLSEYVTGGGTVFLNTHMLENAERLCNRAAIIHRGSIRSLIELEQLRSQGTTLEALFHEMVA